MAPGGLRHLLGPALALKNGEVFRADDDDRDESPEGWEDETHGHLFWRVIALLVLIFGCFGCVLCYTEAVEEPYRRQLAEADRRDRNRNR
jgi:hypothetical protein